MERINLDEFIFNYRRYGMTSTAYMLTLSRRNCFFEEIRFDAETPEDAVNKTKNIIEKKALVNHYELELIRSRFDL